MNKNRLAFYDVFVETATKSKKKGNGNTKKLIALLLCLVLVFGITACSAKTGTPQTAEPAAQETKPAEEAKPAEETKPAEQEAADELGFVPGELPLVTEQKTITIGIRQDSKTEDYETNEYTKWIEEQTGLNLDFVYFSYDKDEAVTQLNLMISGGEKLPDILWGFTGVSSALMYELGEDGYLVDLKDYYDKYAYYFWEQTNLLTEAERANIFMFGTDPTNNAFYAFPRYTVSLIDQCNTLTGINTAWLEAVGAEMPETVDELYEVLKKFVNEDPNGNGQADEMGLVGYEAGYRTDIVSFIINAFVYCCDANFFNVTDGEVWVPYSTDEYRQAMIYLNKLYKEGLLSPLFYTITDASELVSLMTPSDGPAIAGIGGAHPALHYEANNELLYEYQALPPLKAATELGGYAPLRGATYEYNTFITSDCEDPVLAFRLLDFMTSKDSCLRMRYGVYGEDWDYCEPGSMSVTGIPATVVVHSSTAYNSQNNRCWHDVRATVMPISMWSGAWTDDGSWAATRSKLSRSNYMNYAEGKQPAETIQRLVYNEDEQKIVTAIQKPIQDYISEARAMFVSGVMDPNDDAAWNGYLASLESQGLNDLLFAAQSAYSRMTGQ